MKKWMPVCREEDLPGVGSYVVKNIDSESVIIMRGTDLVVRAFHNTCRHRGSALLDCSSGSTDVLQCKYHSWTYDLGGKLVGAPYMEGIADFSPSNYGLLSVRLDTWQGFIFVNFDPNAPPLRESLGDLYTKLDRFRFGEFKRCARLTYDVKSNWKIIQENNLECYHCPTVHPKLVQIVRWDSWKGEGSLCRSDGQAGIYTGASVTYKEDDGGLATDGKRESPPQTGKSDPISERLVFYYQFPILQINLAPDNLAAHYFWPMGPEHTFIQFEIYFDPRVASDSEYVKKNTDYWEQLNQEDWTVCELNQKGTTSRFATPGLFNNFEFLVEDFDRYVLETI
jgi:glycine betaine catabolism A